MIPNLKFRNLYKRAHILNILRKKKNQYLDKDNHTKNIFNIMHDVDYSKENFFNFPRDEINFIIRQKILDNCEILNLTKKFIDSGFLDKFFFAPVPTITIKEINKVIKVQHFLCKIYWLFYLMRSILKAFGKVIFYFFYSLLPDQKINSRSVFFLGFADNMFPYEEIQFNRYNTVSWYLDKEKNLDETTYLHNNNQIKNFQINKKKLIYKNLVNPKIKKFSKLLNFLYSSLFNIFKSIFFLNQYEILVLDEYIDYLAFKSTSKNSLCNKYVFEFGAYLRKPLWTYACIDKNIDIEMICYSVNDSLTFNKNKGYFWNKVMNWPKLIVWDEHHKNNFKNFNQYKKTEYEIVKIIPSFDSNSNQELKKDKKIVSIFDVPMKKISDTFLETIYYEWEYYSLNNLYLFLNDIGEICKNLDVQLVYKKKKKRYKKFLRQYKIENDFVKKYDVIEFNFKNSAIKLVEQSDLVISMPFSSPSLIGHYKGKPSCYYDAENSLDKNLDLSHGLELIQNKTNLEKWIKLNLTNKHNQNYLKL